MHEEETCRRNKLKVVCRKSKRRKRKRIWQLRVKEKENGVRKGVEERNGMLWKAVCVRRKAEWGETQKENLIHVEIGAMTCS